MLAWAALAVSACTSATFGSDKSPFTRAEVNRALAPAAQIERSCYAQSQSRAERRRVQLELIAYVNAQGFVHVDLLSSDARDPELLECLRTRLEELRFPAKGEADQFRLRFELTP